MIAALCLRDPFLDAVLRARDPWVPAAAAAAGISGILAGLVALLAGLAGKPRPSGRVAAFLFLASIFFLIVLLQRA